MKKKIILSLFFGVFGLFLLSGCGKKDYNTNFDNDIILNHLTINEVMISELNTLNDILTKFEDSQILYVTACYENVEEECTSHSFEELSSDTFNAENVKTLGFGISVPVEEKQLIMVFSTYYSVFEQKQKDSKYFSLELLETPGTVKLDDAYIELLPMNDIEDKYEIASRSNDYIYYIDFKSKSGEEYYYTGYPNKSFIQIFNVTERDKK